MERSCLCHPLPSLPRALVLDTGEEVGRLSACNVPVSAQELTVRLLAPCDMRGPGLAPSRASRTRRGQLVLSTR